MVIYFMKDKTVEDIWTRIGRFIIWLLFSGLI